MDHPIIVWPLAALLAAACESDSTSLSEITGQTPDEPVPGFSTAGWSSWTIGNLYLDSAADQAYPIQLLLAEDLRFRALQMSPIVYPRTDVLLRGTFRLEGLLVDGEGIAIAGPGQTWSDGKSVTELSIWGSLVPPAGPTSGKVQLNFTLGSGDTGRIETEYREYWAAWGSSDLSYIAGRWTAAQNEQGLLVDPYFVPDHTSVAIDIAPDGAFSGLDDFGCRLEGRFSMLDTRLSVWSADYAITECSRAGTYSGLVTLRVDGWSFPYLSLSADDGARSQALEFWQAL